MKNQWQRSSEFAIKREGWMIAKAFIDGATLYILSDDAGSRYGHFDSADEAKKYAEAMELAQQL